MMLANRYGPIYRRGLTAVVLLLAMGLGLFLPPGAEAHFTSTGYSDITVKEQELQYLLSFGEHDLMEALKLDQDGDGKLSEQELSDASESLKAFVNDGLIVTGDGKVGQAAIKQVKKTLRAKMPMVELDLVYAFPGKVERFQVQYGFFYNGTNSDHRSFATILLGGQTVTQVLNQNNAILQIQGSSQTQESGQAGAAEEKTSFKGVQPASQGSASNPWYLTLMEYVRMGMEHIWGGADHLLFVAGLIVATRNRKEVVRLITAFTVGHSVTLVLAALELASLSPILVEPLIALSIVYVAMENLNWTRKIPMNRTTLTALFGLVHGFGFAEILQGTLAGHIALPLFSFNLGVELGQLAVIAIVLPLLWVFHRSLKKAYDRWLPGASGLIGLFGVFWFIERVFSI
ncbi:HupE/UreJ family protein [Paenibacillus sp. EPM92]|uniref:HupE/UreJ family protein n=1 Tax=Paenibacillus sp. EPM92 TaxID=1561195 RepID=UPI001915298C|nr:HupE/UreJ family protein [Paenibacillus sp. EPM92]